MKSKGGELDTSDYEDELKERAVKKKKEKFKMCFFCEKFINVHEEGQTLRNKGTHYRCQECYEANIERKTKYKDVICNFCGKKFLHPYYTKKGLTETKNKSKKCEECRNKKIPKGPLPRPKADFLECDLCGMKFKNKPNIYNHMDKHRSDVVCKVCGAKFTARSALRGHLRAHFEKFICELCGYKTNVLSLFRMHKKTHTGTLPTEQKKKNPTKGLTRGTFTCQECGIVFETLESLKSHMKRQHSENGVNGFKCKICGHLSYRVKEHRIHSISHSNKPLVFCHYPGCSIFYNSIKFLNTHIRNVHKKVDGSYSCETCQKTFKYKHSVNKHIRNNRCIPLKERNLGRDAISKSLLNKTTEELERIAALAKEQYLEVRGSITVLEEQQPSDNELEIVEESVMIEESIVNVEALEQTDEETIDESNIFDDMLDSPLKLQETMEAGQIIKTENDEFFGKVEIKTEPDIDMLSSSVQNEWSILSDDLFHLKNEPEINELKMNLETFNTSQNPSVLLERLDYDTIMQWTQVKDETKKSIDIKKESTFKKPLRKNLLKALRMTLIAYNRRRKGEFYECDSCGFKSRKKTELRTHISTHTKEMRQFKHQCRHCGETFTRLSFLKKHLRQIHNIIHDTATKDFVCDLCGKTYYTLSMLKYHLGVAHCSHNIYQCTQCSKSFNTKAYLLRHESDVHDKLKKFPCVYCGKMFTRRYQLKAHELTHTSEVTECKICGKMVKVMKLHMKYVHKKNKKPAELFPCSMCGKEFNKFNLQLHIDRFHLKLSTDRTKIRCCTQCDEIFTRVDDLRRHEILMHYQGIPKRCPYENCDSIFKKTKPLNVHIKNQHTGRIHFCEICGKKYDTRSGLLKHIKIKGHHPVTDIVDDQTM